MNQLGLNIDKRYVYSVDLQFIGHHFSQLLQLFSFPRQCQLPILQLLKESLMRHIGDLVHDSNIIKFVNSLYSSEV